MKIRNGFVSNSSSASFVITYLQSNHIGKERGLIKCLSDGELEKLIDYGFHYSCNCDPFAHGYNNNCDECDYNGSKRSLVCHFDDVFGSLFLRFDVSCNEDEPIKFLIENNIPFVASIYYNHDLIVYKRGMSKILKLSNDGIKYIRAGCMNRDRDKYFSPNTPDDDYSCDRDLEEQYYISAEYIDKEGAVYV